MKRFLSIVPRAVQLWAVIIVVCAVPIGAFAGYRVLDRGNPLLGMLLAACAALVFGIFMATWLLFLGFVFADAKRRGMKPVLWVLVAFLFPHLLGFLLYFVMRQPIAATCAHCGQANPLHQRFCSWCGTALLPPVSTGGPLAANPLPNAAQEAGQ